MIHNMSISEWRIIFQVDFCLTTFDFIRWTFQGCDCTCWKHLSDFCCQVKPCVMIRDCVSGHSGYELGQWEMMLQCNAISHWLSSYPEWPLCLHSNSRACGVRVSMSGVQVHKYLTVCSGLNSLWPSDAIWRLRSGSTLALVMAWCLTAPSHYLNQCWLIISKVQRYSSEGNFTNFPGTNELRVCPQIHSYLVPN